MKKLIPFDIEKAKKGVRVLDHNGAQIRIVCFDGNYSGFPIIDSRGNLYTDKGLCLNNAYMLQLEVESTIRPWKPEEVPVGALIRWKDNKAFITTILSVSIDTIYFFGKSFEIDEEFFEVCLCGMEYSLDLFKPNKTWLPCGVEE
jgi:hypothetical protein